jgi:hypothetical protein
VADSFQNKCVSNPKTHAQLSTTLALLTTFKVFESIMLLNDLLAIVGIALSSSRQLKLLGVLILSIGVMVLYVAIRIRIDVKLFERWDSLDAVALDEALTNLNNKHQVGRALDARLAGSHKLFKRGLWMLLLQSILLILFVWYFKW